MSRSTPPRRRSGKARLEEAVRTRVIGRSGGRCEATVDAGCTGWAFHAHHIVRRSQGGEHTEENLLACCRHCHEWIHQHPTVSYEQGWMRKSGPIPGQTSFDDLL